jgi:hypothetical protein
MAQSTVPPATPASASALGSDPFARLRQQAEQLADQFRQGPLTPWTTYTFEQQLQALFTEAGRAVLQETLAGLESADPRQAAPKVRYQGQKYRRNKRTKAHIATSFGTITLWSWLYLCEEDGEPGLHPLHVRLGLAAAATPRLAERVARQAVDFSQQEVRQWLLSEHGLRWSNDRLRRLLREFRRSAVACRAAAQEQRLLQWLQQAECSRGRYRPVLAVGRDGVMVPLRGQGYQEASAATVSVYDRRGRRLGTVYLGQMPQARQTTLTADLTALVRAVLRQRPGALPRLVYVTDKGQAQDDYYRRVLRRMTDPQQPRRRLAWEWVLDFFHVCGYVGKLREALFGAGGYGWYQRMRHWLRHRPQGVAQVLRSAMQHYNRGQRSAAAEGAFWQAYRYLRRHRRWMDYARYRRVGLPIGSGVTEAACKTVFTQRLKRSGMRWHKESGQVIVDLRIIQRSGIWQEVVRRDLQTRALPEEISSQPQAKRNRRKAA